LPERVWLLDEAELLIEEAESKLEFVKEGVLKNAISKR
jgi:hypothetical protein